MRQGHERQVKDVCLGSPQEPLALQAGQAAGHRAEQHGHRTPAIGDLDGFSGGHASQDRTRLAS